MWSWVAAASGAGGPGPGLEHGGVPSIAERMGADKRAGQLVVVFTVYCIAPWRFACSVDAGLMASQWRLLNSFIPTAKNALSM